MEDDARFVELSERFDSLADTVHLSTRMGNVETKVAVIEAKIVPLEKWAEKSEEFHRDMYSFRDTLLAEQKIQAEVQAQRHEENKRIAEKSARTTNWRTGWILAVCAVVGAIISIMGFIYMIEVKNHAEMDPAKIFHSFREDVQFALEQQFKQVAGTD